MAFTGPADHDMNNVYALNAALFTVIDRHGDWIEAPPVLATRLESLGRDERERLARTPLLLLSVGEQDLKRWSPVFDSSHCRDLVSEMREPPPRVAELAAATLSFLWQLARRDSYAARVLSGASIEWCERLAGSLLLDVLAFGTREPELLSLRLGSKATFWNKLLAASVSRERDIRRAARVCALQTALTSADEVRRPTRRAAACSLGPRASRRH